MICRGGIVVGGRADSLRVPASAFAVPRIGTRALLCALAIAVLAAALGWWVARKPIPPLVESDYCYLLTATERWHAGLGPTTTPPVAPHQPWERTDDWSVLTKWPLGYPAILVALRRAFGVTTLQACQAVACIAWAAALVGWFLWLRRVAPPGLCGLLIAAVGAGSALSTGFLINPSTDLILVAVLPFVLMLVVFRTRSASDGPISAWSGSDTRERSDEATKRRSDETHTGSTRFILAGLLAGGLFWIRYASLFVPAGIGLFLAIEYARRRIALRSLLSFGIAAAAPIVALILFNRSFGGSTSVQSQLNLGEAILPVFSWATPANAWWVFTDLGYYAHRAEAHWLFALLPFVALGLFAWKRIRKVHSCLRHSNPPTRSHPALKRWAIPTSFLRDDGDVRGGTTRVETGSVGSGSVETRTLEAGVILSGCVLLAGLLMLVVGSTFFRDKFDFVGLERYYLPLRPFYFALFVAPIAALSGRMLRASACVALLLAGSWTVQQEWRRDLDRWAAADRTATPYGQWSRCFEPGAAELYTWLREQDDPSLVVLSNFHEFIALETMIPALPIPENSAVLHRWMKSIQQARGVESLRILFVLDPDNQWRSGWIASPQEVVSRFSLRPLEAPDAVRSYVFTPDGHRAESLSLAR